ncbi:hypothetical protein [Bradyrhizobium sp. Tv2a-2]|uniref:hypothetical protein n=1 Tax=Bradyrhizobium sp. Tv2a-2 TaxID=113395 RepID=UPI0004016C67|nr:hypothetical protein [Bradyrhizobium sp. Tv2a-2]
MSPIASPSIFTGLLAMTFSCAALGSAVADSGPDTENGRYTLSQTADGFVRLDTRTGAVSTCGNNGNGWACYAVPDERKAMDTEIGRLQAENERLRAQLASREGASSGKTDEALPKSDKQVAPKAESEPRIEIPLPSDADVDRVMSFLERAWRRLVEMANRVQRDASGKI